MLFVDYQSAAAATVGGLSILQTNLSNLFLAPAGALSIFALGSAMLLAALWLCRNRLRARRRVKLKVLMRALLPRRLTHSASTRADVGFVFFNTFAFGLIFGWAVLSYHLVSTFVHSQLMNQFGAMQPTTLTAFQMSCILTLAIYLAYELGYYIDHSLSHFVPFLWEFHKVHHSAEVLTPLTNSRVHPVDSIVFYNIAALTMGTTAGVMLYLFGRTAVQFTIADSNIITLSFAYLVGHLQHSHIWIAFTGVWGRLLLSPAHHQIHHSTNPLHFNRNMGSFLGIFDWMFGTLHVPSQKREKLTFGVEPMGPEPHSATSTLLQPMVDALKHLKPAGTLQAGGSAKPDLIQPV